MGIEPNISTAGETVEILKKNYGSESVIRDEGAGAITWDANNANWHDRGIVFYSNNVVNSILIWLSGNSVEVKSFVSEIGNPEGVALVVSGPDIKCAGASLVYSQTGLTAFLSSVGKSVGVSKTQIIYGLGIYPPWRSGDFPVTDRQIVPWDGYHEYCPGKWSWEE